MENIIKDLTFINFILGILFGLVIAYILQEIKWKIRKKLNKLWDDPEFDATDFAHPAFFRGEAWSCDMFCKLMNEILDGRKPTGRMYEPLESLRQRIWKLVEEKQDGNS